MTKYSRGGYSIEISDEDGSLIVKAGDSLSAYSMAIHGDFKHIREYSRKNGQQSVPIADVDLIYTGETLFHEPSRPEGGIPVVGRPVPDPVLPKKPDGTYDIARIIKDHNLPATWYDPLNVMLNTARFIQSGLTMTATVFELIALSPTIGYGVALAGPALFFGACYLALKRAMNFGVACMIGRASIYGTVAWAFDHRQPPFPEMVRINIENSHLADRLDAYIAEWDKAAKDAMASCNLLCQQHKADPEAVKIMLQAIGGENEAMGPKYLAARMMLDMAYRRHGGWFGREYDRISFLSPYSWYPSDLVGSPGRYGGRPNYPQDIARDYPFV